MSDFPTTITSPTNPTSGDHLNSPDHALQHQSHNAEIVAIETKIGTGASTPTANTLMKGTGTGTSAWGTLTSANVAAIVTDETGSGSLVFGTSPSLTTPQVATSINDVNGNEVIKTPATGSAVNEVTITNAATGNNPIISATGGDTNIGLTLTPKGTSGIVLTNRFDGWTTTSLTPNTVTALGNRSYSVVFNSTDLTGYLSAGMRLRTTRTVAAPTQCTSLNGTTQYYSKSSPSGAAQTDDITVMAWVKPTAYTGGGGIMSKTGTPGTNGWRMYMDTNGTLVINGGTRYGVSYQSLPLNKWSHVAVSIDMSANSALLYIDGVLVPSAALTSSGASWTSAGNLEVGRDGGAGYFTGKIAQAAVFSSVLSAATILSYMSQGLSGAESTNISAYSFNNSINDLNANANNLTANGSAVATNADSPFGGQADGTISSTLDYGIITKTAFSTNTTLTIQVPEGCTIPTSGGVSAVSYSTQKVPYLFPGQRTKWDVLWYSVAELAGTSSGSASTYSNAMNANMLVPVGEWDIGFWANTEVGTTSAGVTFDVGLGTSTSTVLANLTDASSGDSTSVTFRALTKSAQDFISVSSAAQYYLNISVEGLSSKTVTFHGVRAATKITARNAYL